MPTLPSFVDLLAPERIAVCVEAASRMDVIAGCAQRISASDPAIDAEQLVADLQAREATLSTGVGDGIAIPHARTPAVTRTTAAVATLQTAVDWDAIDGAPVDLVVVFAGPKGDRAAHIRLLAQISRVLSTSGVRQQLAAARTEAEVLDALAAAEGAVVE
ncbi:MAG: PTS sugar transporter subunit IIA [Bacteroidota bacterium]